MKKLSRYKKGTSFVEVLVMLIVAALILAFIQSFFSSSVKQTVKGTAMISTIKEASDLFTAIRKDLSNSLQMSTLDAANNPVVLNLPSADSSLPDPSSYVYPSTLVFLLSENATATYTLKTLGSGKKCVQRILEKGTGNEERFFAVPKMQIFRSLLVFQEHFMSQTPLITRHLYLEIELKPDDPKSQKPARLAFFMSPSKLGLSNWNYSY